MPVAYSGLSVIPHGSMRADTRAHLRADFDLLTIAAGWTNKIGVTNGTLYTVTSPQGFSASLLVQDDTSFVQGGLASNASVVFQMQSVSGTPVGFPHQIAVDPLQPGLQAVVGLCQFFISRPGSSGTDAQTSVAGGVPFIPGTTGPCASGIGIPTVTDIWWSCGGSPFGFSNYDFRQGPNCYAGSSWCLNGTVFIPPDNNSISPQSGYLCLFPLTQTNSYAIFTPQQSITFATHDPLNIDSLVGWNWNIQGQLWDSFVQTAAGTLDLVLSFNDTNAQGASVPITCVTWSASFYLSLMLILTVGGGGGNYAY